MEDVAVTRPLHTAIALLTALVCVSWSTGLWACPNCANRDEGGIGMSLAIGAFLVVPYAVVMVVVRFIRNGEGRADDGAGVLSPPEADN